MEETTPAGAHRGCGLPRADGLWSVAGSGLGVRPQEEGKAELSSVVSHDLGDSDAHCGVLSKWGYQWQGRDRGVLQHGAGGDQGLGA